MQEDRGGAVVELPVLPGEPVCPAAFPIAGVSRATQGVVCKAMERAHVEHDGTGMSAGELGVLRDSTGGVYLNLKSDPDSVTAFCHGDAIPVLTDEEGQGRASYTYCPVWQAEKLRVEEGRDDLVVEAEPEPVSMGVSSMDALDPWEAARQGLEELVPKKAA